VALIPTTGRGYAVCLLLAVLVMVPRACVSEARAATDGLTWEQLERLVQVLIGAVVAGFSGFVGLVAVLAKFLKGLGARLKELEAQPEPKRPATPSDDESSLSAMPWATAIAVRDLEARLGHKLHAVEVERDAQHDRVNKALTADLADRLRLWDALEKLRTETQTSERAARDRDQAQAADLGEIKGLLRQLNKESHR